jgi:hypothetical protein
VIADVDADKIPCVGCEMDVGADGDNLFRVEVPVLVAAREHCKIVCVIGEIVRELQVGGRTLIPAGVAFACSHDEPPVVFVPFETIMTLCYDVIADREAEIMRPWDEIEILRGGAEADLERMGGDGPRLKSRSCRGWCGDPSTGTRSALLSGAARCCAGASWPLCQRSAKGAVVVR